METSLHGICPWVEFIGGRGLSPHEPSGIYLNSAIERRKEGKREAGIQAGYIIFEQK
jgi:hypothetical protein